MSSDSEKANGYHVRFEDGGMPSCDCYDWTEHLLPCKHTFAIILHSREYLWESLPVTYRNAPYITLDEQFSIKSDMCTDEIPEKSDR